MGLFTYELTAVNITLVSMNISRRSIDVAQRAGSANKIIAFELGLKESTVKQYMTRAMKTLGLQNRTELALWYHLHFRQDDLVAKEHNCSDCVLYAVRCAARKQAVDLTPSNN